MIMRADVFVFLYLLLVDCLYEKLSRKRMNQV